MFLDHTTIAVILYYHAVRGTSQRSSQRDVLRVAITALTSTIYAMSVKTVASEFRRMFCEYHPQSELVCLVSVIKKIGCVSFYCKSVRPFVCPWHSSIRWKQLNVLSQFFHHQHQTSSRNSDGITPCGGAKYRWGIKNSRFSTNKSLYLANDTRYRHSYYGRRIGTCMRSIKWCPFQWHWTNSNPVFKVTPLFDAKYLTNGYRYGHSYYRRSIENRT